MRSGGTPSPPVWTTPGSGRTTPWATAGGPVRAPSASPSASPSAASPWAAPWCPACRRGSCARQNH
eukprot:2066472-Pyramimonas_sp.AAC.1